MNFKKIVNTAFLLYGVLIFVGAVLLSQFAADVKSFDPSGGGGLALFIMLGVLGLGVIALVGATAIGVIGWLISLFFADTEDKLSHQDKHCPSCGEVREVEQIICTFCGGSLEQENSSGWSIGAYIVLLIISFILPIFGLIYGGIKVNNAAPNSKQKKQSWTYIYSGIGSILLSLIIRALITEDIVRQFLERLI